MNEIDKLYPIEWNAAEAHDALKKVQSLSTKSITRLAHAIFFGIAATFAAVFNAPLAITFTAIAIVGASVLGYFYFRNKASSLRKELDTQGLTTEKQMQLCLKAFSDELEKMAKQEGPYEKKIDIQPLSTFACAINPLFEGILRFDMPGIKFSEIANKVFHPEKDSPKYSELTVIGSVPLNVDDKLKLDLLELTFKHPFTLKFKDFLMHLLDEKISDSNAEKAGDKFSEATLFSAKYLNLMLNKIDLKNLDAEITAINTQLDSLAFQTYKKINQQDPMEKFPSIALSKNENGQLVVDLTLCGFQNKKNTLKVLAMAEEVIQLLDRENMEIRVHMNRKVELVVYPEEWNEFLSPFTNSVKYKATITDALFEKKD